MINWPSNPIYLTWSLLPVSLVCCLFLFFPDSCRLCSVWVAPLKNATFSSPGAPEMWGGRLRGVVLKKLLILWGRDLERQPSGGKRERGRGREQYHQAKTHRHNNYTYTASRHIMRQCRRNFKEKKGRYIKKQQRASQTERETEGATGGEGGCQGAGEREKKIKRGETMSTFISSVIPHQWRHAAILIKTKNKHR